MPSNRMSVKEYSLKLPPEFPSSSSCNSDLETEYSNFKKRGKQHKENEVPLKKRYIKLLNCKVWLFSLFSK